MKEMLDDVFGTASGYDPLAGETNQMTNDDKAA